MATPKNPKGIVNYRTMSQTMIRCGVCQFWDPCLEECSIVGGSIEEDCVCDLFVLRRPNRNVGDNQLGIPGSVSTIMPLDIPSLSRMDLFRSADVRPGFVRKGVHGGFVVAADEDTDTAWLQTMIDLAAARTGLPTFDGLAKTGEPLLDLVVEGDTARLVDHAPYRMTFAVARADEEKRYTLGPLYMPDTLDAHGDFVTSETLQNAAWGYVRASVQNGSNLIYDQHTDAPAGEWVDLVTWPYEQTVKVEVPGEGEVERTFPPGTVYQGVIWSPEVWEQVKSGEKRGLSMGGIATPTPVDF